MEAGNNNSAPVTPEAITGGIILLVGGAFLMCLPKFILALVIVGLVFGLFHQKGGKHNG